MAEPLVFLSGKQWHSLPAARVAELLGADTGRGLDGAEAERRRRMLGLNVLTPRKGRSPLVRFLLQFHQPLIYVLLVSAAITAFLGAWVDSSVISGVVLVNAVTGYIQEAKAETAIAALARIVTTSATVLRAGRKTRIPSAELVPGDIVLLAAGDKVPADLRLHHVRELAVDESALTGESLPVAKQTAPLAPDTPVADRTDMAYAGSLVVAGGGSGIVVATGDATETGRISRLMGEAEPLSTPLTRRIERFSRVLLYAIFGLAALTFALGLLRGQSIFEMFMAAVALAVGAIPEGLPAAVTVTLAIGVERMARRRAIIRRLPAVETLGSTTVICTDKTGTLTQNQMTVQEIFAGGGRYAVSGVGYGPAGEILQQGGPAAIAGALRECLLAGVLCNDSSLEQKGGRWMVAGDPTEGALIVAARKGGMDRDALARAFPRLDSIPFESRRQYMATLHRRDGEAVVYLKGAVERVLERCGAMLDGEGRESPLERQRIEEAAAEMAAAGLRVLAFARGRADPGTESLEHRQVAADLVFLGLQGMIDPPRPEAVAAVETCRQAGIAVKMITGDHAVTAGAVARKMGIGAADGGLNILTGRQLAALDDGQLVQAVRETAVFARIEPEQKLRLVKAFQAQGEVVAMTGDGVNDGPALRQADIGVAMGLAGTEVAREAADMILTDDNFASIEAAVEEGRGVFDNLTKFIVWTLPTNFGEGLVITAAIVAGAALPILPVQILWINMTTAVLLGLTLAFEPIEAGIMRRPPRRPETPILSRELALRILSVGALLLIGAFGLFLWELERGSPVAVARTAAANVFVVGETFYLFNCRSMTRSMFGLGVFSNRWLVAGVILMLLLQLAFTYLPVMNAWFRTAPIGAATWLRIALAGGAIYALIGFEKWLRNRYRTARAVSQG
jgi:Ca2+-transporting ATPase